MSSLALSFNNVNFLPVQLEQQIWLTASELAKALGYAKSDAVTQIYERNKDEFNESMTTTLKMSVVRKTGSVETLNLSVSKKDGNLTKTVRVFNSRGCHLIAMFSKTAIAKTFRKWVLDVLDRAVGKSIYKEPKITAEQKQEIKEAVNARHHRTGEHWQTIYHNLHQFIGVNSYHEIPSSKFYDAIYWLNDGWVSNRTQVQPWHDPQVQRLMYYIPKLHKYIANEVYPALTAMQSNFAGNLHGFSQDVVVHANTLNRLALESGMTHLNHFGGMPVHRLEWYLTA